MHDPTPRPHDQAARQRALVLDDEPTTVLVLQRLLEGQNLEALGARTIAEAFQHIEQGEPDVVIVDVHLRAESGLDFVQSLRTRAPGAGIIVISAEDTDTLASKALALGADNFLSKPIAPTALLLTLRNVLELRKQRRMAVDLRKALEATLRDTEFPGIVTRCDAMRAVLRLVEKVGPRDLAVLVCGESGTGKELVARAIHNSSARRDGPFVELNCAALPPNLVESELFGHERGAFTGAVASRVGKIEQASGGTLFLDEIGELPLDIQPKLLRALQERHIVPVGGKESRHCDFRLVSATNRDLVDDVRQARFREDLFYRVAVFPIMLPPLRNRMEDLDLLLLHFLVQEGVSRPHIEDAAMQLLMDYRWPGNVRELRNFAQAITLFCEGGVIDRRSVESYFGSRLAMGRGGAIAPPAARGSSQRPVRPLADVERDEITHALGFHEGNVSEAARALGMGRATLYKYIKREKLDPDAIAREAAEARERRSGERPGP